MSLTFLRSRASPPASCQKAPMRACSAATAAHEGLPVGGTGLQFVQQAERQFQHGVAIAVAGAWARGAAARLAQRSPVSST
jgi:hypothetical protein